MLKIQNSSQTDRQDYKDRTSDRVTEGYSSGKCLDKDLCVIETQPRFITQGKNRKEEKQTQ